LPARPLITPFPRRALAENLNKTETTSLPFGVCIALSSGRKTRVTLLIVFHGALKSGSLQSTKYEY
jgi:hypothetical protein